MNNYNLPFKPEDKVIELGGGDKPMFHPNVDVRSGPQTDFVANFEEPLPIKDSEWDGVFSSYCLEHISWRNLKGFITEVNRILKPGGTAVFITANTEAQMKHLLDTQDWDDAGSMLFGGQDFDDNVHKNFLSPTFATKLLQECGFEKVTVLSWGAKKTDMLIEATKKGTSLTNRVELYDRHYFHGGTKVGGYPNEGYRDFTHNWVIFDKIMEEKPASVLELGCAKGFMLKRLQDAGIPAGGFDISKHCFLSRVCDNVIVKDICETPWGLADKAIDLCFSNELLPHIPEEFIPAVMIEMARASNRGLHSISSKENTFDKTRCTVKPLEWWKNVLPEGHKIVYDIEHTDGLIYDHIPAGDGKLKVNVGSYINMAHHDWVNIDVLDLNGFAFANNYKFHQKDAKEALPFENQTVDLMYSSHFLEHLTYAEGKSFLKECKRVLKDGGVIRIIVPDTRLLIHKYLNGDLGNLDEINDGAAETSWQAGKLWAFLFSGHSAAYDFEAIQTIASEVGLRAELRSFRVGHEQIIKETLDLMPEISLFVELSN